MGELQRGHRVPSNDACNSFRCHRRDKIDHNQLHAWKWYLTCHGDADDLILQWRFDFSRQFQIRRSVKSLRHHQQVQAWIRWLRQGIQGSQKIGSESTCAQVHSKFKRWKGEVAYGQRGGFDEYVRRKWLRIDYLRLIWVQGMSMDLCWNNGRCPDACYRPHAHELLWEYLQVHFAINAPWTAILAPTPYYPSWY